MGRFLSWATDFLLSETSRRAVVPTQPSIQWLPGIKRPGPEADHTPPCSADVRNKWNYNYTPPVRLHTAHIAAYCDSSLPSFIRLTPIFYASHVTPNSSFSIWVATYACQIICLLQDGRYASLLGDLFPKYLEYELRAVRFGPSCLFIF